MQEQSIEELIYNETEKRLQEMEREDYEFPERINKTDYIIMAAGFIGSVILIILCMLGVIN